MNGIKSTFESLRKMDPALARALANVRAGTATKQDADLLARGMYTDTLIPKMGNKMAYNDFLSRNENQGIHVNADLNDFGQINKLHGDAMGDEAIKKFGNIASEVSRMFGGKAFRSGGDEFKFWFHKPEHAHGFSRELRARLEREPKVAGTHNLAASIGIGFNRGHAESSLLEAKKQLGPTVQGKRQNLHSVGNAPTVIHSKIHEPTPEGWKPSKGAPDKQPKTTPNLAEPGLKFHNPLGKNETHTPVPQLVEYREVSPHEFESAISKHPNQASLDSPRHYTNKRTFLSSTDTSGYALKPDGELNHVFSLTPGEGSHAVKHAINNGAKHLSAFDGKLPIYYSKFGFNEYKREPNWIPGHPDVVYMKL